MPYIINSSYVSPSRLFNAHIQSAYVLMVRSVKGVAYTRERIVTQDDDFLDLDWSQIGSKRLAIVSPGWMSYTGASYMLGMAKALNRAGYDVMAWNYRGCSGEPNRQPYYCHAGFTEDLDLVIRHALGSKPYDEVVLVGFSMGGNLTLKYVGERGSSIHPSIRAAVAFSVPCNMAACSKRIVEVINRAYFHWLYYGFRRWLEAKAIARPDFVTADLLKRVKSWKDFDDLITAPLFGFENAEAYWSIVSCGNYLEKSNIPTLLVNAQDDPLLSPLCFPADVARSNPNFHFEAPQMGGHVGFVSFDREGEFWSETRAVEFLLATR